MLTHPSFLRNVDWRAVEGRLDDASKVAPPRPLVQEEFADLPGVGVEEVRAMLADGRPLQLIDARYMTVGHSGWKAVGAPIKMNT